MWVDRYDSAERYKASIFFNYQSAIWLSLVNVTPYPVIDAIGYLVILFFTRIVDPRKQIVLPRKLFIANFILHFVHFAMFVMMIVAVILMFNTLDSRGVDTSVYITQSVAFAILALTLTTVILMVVHWCIRGVEKPWMVIGALVRCSLLVLWSSFMASRMFMPLDNPVRSSEAMFYFFNFLPLLFIAVLPSSLPVFHTTKETFNPLGP
ncbi:hypothetical protein GGI21_002342 [Coemansia aciculifera]|nr:hypothetical protein GGI21_002342 [Coemansia aciculifera]